MASIWVHSLNGYRFIDLFSLNDFKTLLRVYLRQVMLNYIFLPVVYCAVSFDLLRLEFNVLDVHAGVIWKITESNLVDSLCKEILVTFSQGRLKQVLHRLLSTHGCFWLMRLVDHHYLHRLERLFAGLLLKFLKGKYVPCLVCMSARLLSVPEHYLSFWRNCRQYECSWCSVRGIFGKWVPNVVVCLFLELLNLCL